jgi:2-polyprenyl-6-methoxyphenol hydroxylase-like FAD-dependent oxidoreductase
MACPGRPSIAIIGGGLAGLTLSIGLTRYGISHKIYESASAFSEIGAGIALGPNSITALELIDPRIKEGLRKCVTYNEGVNAEGQGKGREEWLDIRLGEEEG